MQALPETTMLSEKMSNSFDLLGGSDFNGRGIVTDNHTVNVNAFTCLSIEYGTSEFPLFIKHLSNHSTKIYLFYDSVHGLWCSG